MKELYDFLNKWDKDLTEKENAHAWRKGDGEWDYEEGFKDGLSKSEDIVKHNLKTLTILSKDGTPLEVEVVWTKELKDFLNKFNNEKDNGCVAFAYDEENYGGKE